MQISPLWRPIRAASGRDDRNNSELALSLFLVVQQAEDLILFQPVAALQKIELDGEAETRDSGAELAGQFAVASMVPPVASKSSTMTTFWPGSMASKWISSASVPYSRS